MLILSSSLFHHLFSASRQPSQYMFIRARSVDREVELLHGRLDHETSLCDETHMCKLLSKRTQETVLIILLYARENSRDRASHCPPLTRDLLWCEGF